jgi:glycosyltransferase involved in cell wall biosynthesis
MSFNFNGPITERTSYGLVALNIIENSDCRAFPIGQIDRQSTKKWANLSESLDSSRFDPNLPSVRLYHQFDLALSVGRGMRVGWPIFELDRFNPTELAHLRSCDRLAVCSEWAKSIIEANSINAETYVVPLGVDRSIFHEVDYVPPTYTFLSAGKWEVRKGQDQIVETFNRAFEPTDNVELWLSMANIFMDKSFMEDKQREYGQTKMGRAGHIKFVGPFRSQQDLARIMNMVSCGIFPSKAEGWGLESLEMMSCGKPLIVSDYSGHTEYCNSSNSILLPISRIEPAHDSKWFFGQGNWAIIDDDAIIEAMRGAYGAGPKVNGDGIKTAHSFSWQNSVAKLKEALL